VPFDRALFDEAMSGQIANVALHLCTIALVSEMGEIISRHHAELADVRERSHFGSTQRVFPVSRYLNFPRTPSRAIPWDAQRPNEAVLRFLSRVFAMR
jgi:hypothetical protein